MLSEAQQKISDQRFMAIAVRLAKRGLGTVAPNPAVGAVVVDPSSNEIVARGWTQPGGRPHAEPNALQRAGDRAKGATLYVTLEPCSHHGKSPPCVDAILSAGIARVVCGIEDPDPRVAGRGLARLREAGVEVLRGIRREACFHTTLGHILRVTERRPLVQLKMALAADGEVPRGIAGQPHWVTGEDARQRGHLLRAQSDAILVGRGTFSDDDPTLTCRLPGLQHRSPSRVVLIGGVDRIPASARMIGDGGPGVWWVVGRNRQGGSSTASSDDNIIRVPSVAGRLWLPAVMEALVERGVTRLLVEGGPTIWRSFDRAGLVDEVVMFLARGGKEPYNRETRPQRLLSGYVERTPLRMIAHQPLLHDDMFVFHRAGQAHEKKEK